MKRSKVYWWMRHLSAMAMVLGLLATPACAAESQSRLTIALKPEMEAVQRVDVIALNRAVPEAVAQVSMEPAKANAWVFDAKDGGQVFDLTVRRSEDSLKDELILTVWDWENRPVFRQTIGEDPSQPVRLKIEGRGVYLLTLDGFREGKQAYRLIRSVAVIASNDNARQRWGSSDYWLGICAFPGRYHWSSGGQPTKPAELSEHAARELEADLAARLGLRVARLDVSMVLPEKEATAIDWSRMDAAVDAYTSRGFGLALQLMHPPDWAMVEAYKNETKDRWRFPRREEPYRRYVKQIVERYGKHAKFVQIYNEPDQIEFWAASPEEFVTEFGWAREEIRRASPGAVIANGGYAFIDAKRTEFYVEKLKGQIDLAAYHSHGNLRELKRDMMEMRQLHERAGYVMPRYANTECGFAAWRLDQERVQAASVVQKVMHSWAHGDEGMLMFAMRMTKGPGRSGRDFGFLDYHFCPRFVYGAIAALVDVYAGAKFDGVLRETDDAHVYQFSRGEERLIACFSIAESRRITLRSDAKRAWLVDAMGNRSELKDAKRIEVSTGALVKSVVLEGAMRVEMEE